jgi:hypothetical protein
VSQNIAYPSFILGYHSCDREVARKILNGEMELNPSNNSWDWLGDGVYLWEYNPGRAFEYAEEVSTKAQFNKGAIKTPFVIGAIVNLGNCLNLVESTSLEILKEGYTQLKEKLKLAGQDMPTNKGANRQLDCSVVKSIHEFNKQQDKPAYDTVRAAFQEGELVYEGASFSLRSHIQICVRNPDNIIGYFLPKNIGGKALKF